MTRTHQRECEHGYYCQGGLKFECGSSSVYCEARASTPKAVQGGYYSVGGSSNRTRSGQQVCETGFYCQDGVKRRCPEGQFASEVGSLTCSDPESGTYIVNASAAILRDCEPGFYCQNGIRSKCEAGQYASVTSSTFCKLADRGYAAPTPFNQSICLPGTYSENPGSEVCLPCPQGSVAPLGSSFCTRCATSGLVANLNLQICEPCPSNAQSGDGILCECDQGYYLTYDFSECSLCPEGADCSQNNLTSSSIVASKGYWRDPTNAGLVLYKCLDLNKCTGYNDEGCALHHTGPLCELCVIGCTKSFGTCIKCPGPQASAGVAMVLFFFSVFVLATFLNFALRQKETQYQRYQGELQYQLNKSLRERRGLQPEDRFIPTAVNGAKVGISFLQIQVQLDH